MVNAFRKKRERIRAKNLKLLKELQALREACPHENLMYKLCGDSGNYDKSLNVYWIEWRCDDCEKRWETSQDNCYHQTTVEYPQAKRVTKW